MTGFKAKVQTLDKEEDGEAGRASFELKDHHISLIDFVTLPTRSEVRTF